MNAINRCIGTMDFLMPLCAAETERASGSSEQFEATKENLRRRYALTASQMRCPLHQRGARVELYGDRLGDLEVEVFTCCDEFAQRVHDTLRHGTVTAQRRAA